MELKNIELRTRGGGVELQWDIGNIHSHIFFMKLIFGSLMIKYSI